MVSPVSLVWGSREGCVLDGGDRVAGVDDWSCPLHLLRREGRKGDGI